MSEELYHISKDGEHFESLTEDEVIAKCEEWSKDGYRPDFRWEDAGHVKCMSSPKLVEYFTKKYHA